MAGTAVEEHSGRTRRARSAAHPRSPTYLPVTWSYLARLDEVPCDIWLDVGRFPVLYATRGASPDVLREKARARVPMLVREADSYLLRRMLTVSLGRTLADRSLSPADRSREAYGIAATIVGGSLRAARRFDADEAVLATDTIDLLTTTLADEDETLWAMVASMQRFELAHHHAISTAVYSVALARRHGITDHEALRVVGRGGLLADIGLTTVPARVLESGDELDPRAVRAIRQHPVVGHAIVARALGDAPACGRIILEHHERLDGSGYPAGLRGLQIALESQIVGIADTYDRLTTPRGEIAARSPLAACTELRLERRGQFSDHLVGELVRLLGGWDALRESRD